MSVQKIATNTRMFAAIFRFAIATPSAKSNKSAAAVTQRTHRVIARPERRPRAGRARPPRGGGRAPPPPGDDDDATADPAAARSIGASTISVPEDGAASSAAGGAPPPDVVALLMLAPLDRGAPPALSE